MATEAERQAEALQRLLDLLDALYNVLSDEELLRTATKLIMTPELFLVLDRAPQIIAALEKLSRPEVLASAGALAEALSRLDPKALSAIAEALSRPPEVPKSLSQLIAQLGDPAVLRGLSIMISIAKAIGSR
ncbi:MAG: DUF1641 domain-containing protein [Acidilobus sp.]